MKSYSLAAGICWTKRVVYAFLLCSLAPVSMTSSCWRICPATYDADWQCMTPPQLDGLLKKSSFFSRQSPCQLFDGHVSVKHLCAGLLNVEAKHDSRRSIDRSPSLP